MAYCLYENFSEGHGMTSPRPENYHVAMKAFVRKGDLVLICRDALDTKFDLPGGRIGVGEFEMPLEEVLKREIAEELGADFEYRNNGPAAIFRYRRPELTSEGKPEVRIFMVGFELEYLGGEIKLSDEHSDCKWVSLTEAAGLLPDGPDGGQGNGMRKYIRWLEKGKWAVEY